jgi:hypothetical protein
MADDINPELRTQLTDALAVLAPQIRGLHDLAAVSQGELASTVNNQITARERRRDLIQTVLDHLDTCVASLGALEDDGYPALPQVPMLPAQFTALEGEASDITAAVGIFTEEASKLSVGLGNPAEKPAEQSGD